MIFTVVESVPEFVLIASKRRAEAIVVNGDLPEPSADLTRARQAE
jgi:hypothetical protein